MAERTGLGKRYTPGLEHFHHTWRLLLCNVPSKSLMPADALRSAKEILALYDDHVIWNYVSDVANVYVISQVRCFGEVSLGQ
jgi:hypothetical protein